MIPPNENWLRVATMLQTFAQCGVRYAVVSPGSRSTPLAHVALHTSGFETIVDIDERSAAFIALGIGKATGIPAVLICTSGTAVANYYPAIVEASMSHIPMLVLTADRPARLQNRGAPQTIDQKNIFGKFARFATDLPFIESNSTKGLEIIRLSLRAYDFACGTNSGAVHINCPFDDPLQPIRDNSKIDSTLWSKVSARISREIDSYRKSKSLDTKPVTVKRTVLSQLRTAQSFVIVAGPDTCRDKESEQALADFANAINAPLLADVCSGIRTNPAACDYPDLLAQCLMQKEIKPDTILWLGIYPTSKPLAQWMSQAKAVIRIQSHRDRIDPDNIVTGTIIGNTQEILSTILPRLPISTPPMATREIFAIEQKLYWEVSQPHCIEQLPTFVKAILNYVKVLPTDSNLVLANSMSIRYADRFLTAGKPLHIYANKGVNGIDGTLSTVIGIAKATGRTTLLVTGDVAFLHDMNAVSILAREQLPITILLLNDNGGGIFYHLPIANVSAQFDNEEQVNGNSFETLHGTPHNADFSQLASAFAIPHRYYESSDYELHDWRLPQIIEVATDRIENAKQYRVTTNTIIESVSQFKGTKKPKTICDWHISRYGNPQNPPLLMLHGFAASGSVWLPFVPKLSERYHLIVPDLPGHRFSKIFYRRSAAIVDVAKSLHEVMQDEYGKPYRIVGYSMGARIAYTMAANFPASIRQAMFLSGTTGIEDDKVRANRLASDISLANSIEKNGVEWFARNWEQLPIFSTRLRQDPSEIARIRRQWLQQDPKQLSQALRMLSVGNQPDLLQQLRNAKVPAMIVVGTKDEKYRTISERIALEIPQWNLLQFDCGHDILTEKREELLQQILRYFTDSDEILTNAR